MSISYVVHSTLQPGHAQAIVEQLRADQPDWFAGRLLWLDEVVPP